MRSLGQISEKLSCDVSDIENICIWGNHSATQFPDTTFATVKGEKLTDKCDKEYLEGEFITKVAKRGAEIISVMDKSSCASAAAAICEHMHDWWFGNQIGGWVSMGVQVEGGRYGVDGDLVFGYPCNVGADGEWSIVEGLELNDFQKGKIDATMKELQEERMMALGR
jgi:malate dehydrogenase